MIRFTISKTTADSYLKQQPEPLRKLAEECARAFVRGLQDRGVLHMDVNQDQPSER
jgi:hypothetical protein